MPALLDAQTAPAATGAAPLAFVPAAPEPGETPPYLDASFNGVRMTPAAFDAIADYDELYHYELVGGRVAVHPLSGDAVAAVTDLLGVHLNEYRLRHPRGGALDATLPNRLVGTGDGRRLADRVLWCGLGRRPDTVEDVPSVVVEVVSPRRRDRVRDYDLKRDGYREAGVLEYWLVGPRERSLTTFTAAGGWAEATLRAGDALTTPLLPGFELPVNALLAVADAVGDGPAAAPDADRPADA